jgi:hypothetical protein
MVGSGGGAWKAGEGPEQTRPQRDLVFGSLSGPGSSAGGQWCLLCGAGAARCLPLLRLASQPGVAHECPGPAQLAMRFCSLISE